MGLRIRQLTLWLLAPMILVSPRVASARPPPQPNAFALIVGSNRGGPGQMDLRFAHEDVRRFLQVLTEAGGFARENVQVVLEPGLPDLLGALDRARRRLADLAGRGEPSIFLFYYSGHARSRSLTLGTEELELQVLRRRLESLPATVSVAILDACQTGAISRVKGAVPAVDFSYNSVNDLRTAGVAVMASSSASELSQEAESLGASYFTHHLVTGLRGAADTDEDGGVTLSEAYRYAYHRTLVATASTAVGSQHVTLETRLRGKGEMVLTYPGRSDSAIELPPRLAAQVLVHRQADQIVMAELSKARGSTLRLALPAGRYVAILRREGRRQVVHCELEVPVDGHIALAPSHCRRQAPAEGGVKGAAGPWQDSWALEVGIGATLSAEDSYNQQLENFGWQRQLFQTDELLSATVALSRRINPYLAAVAAWTMLDRAQYRRTVYSLDKQEREQAFSWSAHCAGLYVRGMLPLLRGRLTPYVQTGGGLSWSVSELVDQLPASEVVDDQTHWGWHVAASLGVTFMPWRHVGLYLQANYIHAPALSNLVGDRHNNGGPSAHLGVRGAL